MGMKNKIADYLEKMEEKRRKLFEPFPDDERNIISEKTMKDFIDYVKAQPDDHVILRRMEKYQYDDEVYIPSAESEYELYKFMFSYPVEDFDSILSLIADLDFKQWFRAQNTYYGEKVAIHRA
ncbi:MAG: hypothetical protein PHO01_03050 [Desulfotomaculaceae bacterium]|nr:hypothetical protein [Desulfotomaculaceae bacterium]